MKCIYQLLVAITATLFLAGGCSGCLFDPTPEPDPAREEETDWGGETETDSDGENGDDSVDASVGFEGAPPAEDRIYCSAPGPSGMVSVVGLSGAAMRGNAIEVLGGNGQLAQFEIDQDGSFAGRIQADPGELLSVHIVTDSTRSEPMILRAGTLEVEGDYFSTGIVGDNVASAPDNEGQVAIHGEGERLESGLLVIGGNVTLSSGRDTLVSCSGGCRFDIFIPGDEGDQVDLFLVRTNEHSGISNSETVTVPGP
ncbi:MAG: hypothetical protein GY854_20385 [Deltaproteobacteria bacterium]|nr:hypothetical protein [Deltaproteobacteria bacterium]